MASAACSVHILDPSRNGQWDSFVASHPDGTLYHLSCWKDIIERSFGYAPLYHVLEDAQGTIRGGIPLFAVRGIGSGDSLVSLPFSDYCSPLVGSEVDLESLLAEIARAARGRGSTCLRFCVAGGDAGLGRRGFRLEAVYKNHVLRIDRPIEEIRRSVIAGSRRRNLNVAARSGVSIVYARGEEDLRAYYRMYVLTRRKHGLVPLPFRFFKNVWATLAPRGMACLALAVLRSQPIAGILLLRYESTLYCLSNASKEQFLQHRPNDLLWWEGIELAVREKLLLFDFGRTSIDNEGLLSFKRKWGTEERDIRHYVQPLFGGVGARREALASSSLLRGVVRHAPPFALRLGGKLAYRILG